MTACRGTPAPGRAHRGSIDGHRLGHRPCSAAVRPARARPSSARTRVSASTTWPAIVSASSTRVPSIPLPPSWGREGALRDQQVSATSGFAFTLSVFDPIMTAASSLVLPVVHDLMGDGRRELLGGCVSDVQPDDALAVVVEPSHPPVRAFVEDAVPGSWSVPAHPRGRDAQRCAGLGHDPRHAPERSGRIRRLDRFDARWHVVGDRPSLCGYQRGAGPCRRMGWGPRLRVSLLPEHS